MTSIPDIFDGAAHFDPAEDFEAFLKRIPAKGVVYLLADGNDHPVQLLCVRNLRSSLKRRLSGGEAIGPSKRVNYRDLGRRSYWRRAGRAIRAGWTHVDGARPPASRNYARRTGSWSGSG